MELKWLRVATSSESGLQHVSFLKGSWLKHFGASVAGEGESWYKMLKLKLQ